MGASLTARDADDNTATDTVNIVVGEGAGTPRVWGDVNCDGAANELDLLAMLRFEAGLDPGQAPGCPEIGTPLAGQPAVWGDVDCGAGAPNAADGLAIVCFAIGRPPDIAGCPPLGSVVFVAD